jgi:predicted amidophosphoribosyltransferase
MARQFLRRWKQFLRESAGADAVDGADTVDGADVVAALCPQLETYLLIRQKETVMLRSLNPEERRLALEDAFAVNAALRDRVAGKNVLLIDDIYTTGATADACSTVLLEAGAEAVYLLTLCSGGNHRPKGE